MRGLQNQTRGSCFPRQVREEGVSQRHRSRIIDVHYLIVHGQVDGLRGRKIVGPLKTGIDEDTVYVRI